MSASLTTAARSPVEPIIPRCPAKAKDGTSPQDLGRSGPSGGLLMRTLQPSGSGLHGRRFESGPAAPLRLADDVHGLRRPAADLEDLRARELILDDLQQAPIL